MRQLSVSLEEQDFQALKAFQARFGRTARDVIRLAVRYLYVPANQASEVVERFAQEVKGRRKPRLP